VKKRDLNKKRLKRLLHLWSARTTEYELSERELLCGP